MIDIFTRAYGNLQTRLDGFLGDGVSNVIQEVDGPLRAALLLYFVLYGIAILRGVIDEPIMEGVMRMIKLAFVYSITTTVAYNDWVTEPLFHVLPNALTTAISGQATPSVGAAFDEYFSRGGILAQETFKTASPVNPGPYLTGALVYLVTALTAAVGFGVTMIAMIALSLVIALGPIFIACIVFEPTRRFFVGWLSQCLNYVLLFALIVTIFQMILSIIADEWTSLDGAAQPEAAAMVFVAFSLLGSIFFLATPMIASGISGSASLAVKDFARAGAWMHHHASRVSTDPPSVWWTPMLALRSWRGVSDERYAPGVSGDVQARGGRSGDGERPVGGRGGPRAGAARDGASTMDDAVRGAGDGGGEAPHHASAGPVAV